MLILPFFSPPQTFVFFFFGRRVFYPSRILRLFRISNNAVHCTISRRMGWTRAIDWIYPKNCRSCTERERHGPGEVNNRVIIYARAKTHATPMFADLFCGFVFLTFVTVMLRTPGSLRMINRSKGVLQLTTNFFHLPVAKGCEKTQLKNNSKMLSESVSILRPGDVGFECCHSVGRKYTQEVSRTPEVRCSCLRRVCREISKYFFLTRQITVIMGY